MRCEDYPCCGHEDGDCPTIDEDGNKRWTCVLCYRLLPVGNTSSICNSCLHRKRRTNWDDDYSMDY